ncbi:MAG: hypothetical protein EA375_03350 [Acholeplasmataceae bacterium]|nr:MAG: hypothetical protein EA375_03350 [Acholeplasmataceae bacterium]
MAFLNRLMASLNGQMNRPVPYQGFAESWLHYLALVLVVLATVVAVTRLKRDDDRAIRHFVLGVALVMIVFEIYKQLNFSYTNNWNYRWYAFPFQFCSTPMYVALLAGLLTKGKVQDALYAFLATFGLFAGVAVMIHPNDVFVTTTGINIQTMVHHGAMAVMGIALLAKRVRLEHRVILGATVVFAITLIMAMGLNTWHNTFIQEGTFNMFFINPLYGTHLPILSIIYDLVPYPAFLFIYTVGFGLVAYLMLLIGMGVSKIMVKRPAETYELQ